MKQSFGEVDFALCKDVSSTSAALQWNGLPHKIVSTLSLELFKKSLDGHGSGSYHNNLGGMVVRQRDSNLEKL